MMLVLFRPVDVGIVTLLGYLGFLILIDINYFFMAQKP